MVCLSCSCTHCLGLSTEYLSSSEDMIIPCACVIISHKLIVSQLFCWCLINESTNCSNIWGWGSALWNSLSTGCQSLLWHEYGPTCSTDWELWGICTDDDSYLRFQLFIPSSGFKTQGHVTQMLKLLWGKIKVWLLTSCMCIRKCLRRDMPSKTVLKMTRICPESWK